MDMFHSLGQGAWYFFWVRGIALVLEVVYLLRKKGNDSDVVPNIACGIMIYAFFKYVEAGTIYGFMVLIATLAPWQLESTWWLFGLTILAADLSFYIYHRASHQIRFLWADHSVHHSSEEYDLTTNLRGSFISGTYSWLPIVPVLLLGVNPALVGICRSLVNDYTFFLHTQYVKKLGFLEHILNTPAHHRVHHAKNPEYIDKNFGFLLIIWDKLFGTYAEEKTPCVFGTVRVVSSKNPLYFLSDGWLAMYRDVVAAKDLRGKMATLFYMRYERENVTASASARVAVTEASAAAHSCQPSLRL